MEKKERSKSKTKTNPINSEVNGEKFNKIKSKIKQIFSQKSIRNILIPCSTSTYHDKSLLSASRENERRLRQKSNNTSPTFFNYRIDFNGMTQLSVSNNNHESIELPSILQIPVDIASSISSPIIN